MGTPLTIYRFGQDVQSDTQFWFHWTTDADVVKGPVAGDTTDFLERASKIQWGLMVCVYCVSHAPALLMLEIPGFEGQNVKLLLFLIVVREFYYFWIGDPAAPSRILLDPSHA